MAYSKNPGVRTYIFPSLAKQVLIFGGSYWQFRLPLSTGVTFDIFKVLGTIPCNKERLNSEARASLIFSLSRKKETVQ